MKNGLAAFAGALTPLDDLYSIPDCWNIWVRIWRDLQGSMHKPEVGEGPEMVLVAKGRRDLRELIECELENADSAATFCHEIGLDDYYGDYAWPPHTYWQMSAIRHGCKMIQAQIDAQNPVWADPVV